MANQFQLVHGLSIPLGKLGLYLPRTLSTALSQENSDSNFQLGRSTENISLNTAPHVGPGGIPVPRKIWRIGRPVRSGLQSNTSRGTSHGPTPRTASPTRATNEDLRSPVNDTNNASGGNEGLAKDGESQLPPSQGEARSPLGLRSIRFPDEGISLHERP